MSRDKALQKAGKRLISAVLARPQLGQQAFVGAPVHPSNRRLGGLPRRLIASAIADVTSRALRVEMSVVGPDVSGAAPLQVGCVREYAAATEGA